MADLKSKQVKINLIKLDTLKDYQDEYKKNFEIKELCKLYSNEIVFRGHPDKVCDQISASILKYYMSLDPNTRAGIETAGGKGKIFITGEVTSKANVPNKTIKKIVQSVLDDVDYQGKYKIIVNISKQSPDIAQGVDTGGAGDQGMMFGYACRDTIELLPTAMVILQKFAEWYESFRGMCSLNGEYGSDGKAQITGYYDKKWKLVKIKTFLVSYQNNEEESTRLYGDMSIRNEIKFLCSNYGLDCEEIIINPTGKFKVGGFEGDAGLTGRKIVVDAYQSFANVGGGCMNGKDPTKVDFSGAHKARQIACDYLKKYHLGWCEVQLSYAIGIAKPMAIYIRSNKGNITPSDDLYKECEPNRIINDLKLKNIDYVELAKFGHFR